MRVHLLGELVFLAPKGELVMPTAKARLLAAYMFWNQGRWLRRDDLRTMFWGEVGEKRAAGSLRTAVYQVRRALADRGILAGYLEVNREAVRIVPEAECWVDAAAFERRALEGLSSEGEDISDLVAAADLYRGEFLRDLDVEWCNSERARLSDLHLAVLRTLVDRLTNLGRSEAALLQARRWLAVNPLDESAHQSLMLIYSRLGQPNRVLEQFEECRRVLDSELGVVPSEDTVRLLREIERSVGKGELSNSKERRKTCRTLSRGDLPLSSDPLHNARLLLSYGGMKALAGDIAEARRVIVEAIGVYERLASSAERAKAWITVAEVCLTVFVNEFPLGFTERLNWALSYYREKGPSVALCKALEMASIVAYRLDRFEESLSLASEGKALAHQFGDIEAEWQLTLTMGMAYRDSLRLKEARQEFDLLTRALPGFRSDEDIVRLALNRGILLVEQGEWIEAEKSLREALVLSPLVLSRSPLVRYNAIVAQGFLVIANYYRGARRIREWSGLPIEFAGILGQGTSFIIPLFLPSRKPEDERVAVDKASEWLRGSWDTLPVRIALISCTLLVERMLAMGLYRRASEWASAGVRSARLRRLPGWVTLFRARRSVALALQGRVDAAESCRRSVDDRDTPGTLTKAWLARADGLIAAARGRPSDALQFLNASRDLFSSLGDVSDSRHVSADFERLKVLLLDEKSSSSAEIAPSPS